MHALNRVRLETLPPCTRASNSPLRSHRRQEEFHKKCSEFSGGWQMRIGLARLLLGPAGSAATGGKGGGMMFLDEPSNHLDSGQFNNFCFGECESLG